MKKIHSAIKAIKNIVTAISNRLKMLSRSQRLIIVTISFVILFIISLFFYKPVLSNIYWKMAVKASSTDFDKALIYIDRAYDLTHEEFLKEVKVGFYINEARKVMKSDPDKALALLEACYKIKQNSETKDLIVSICIDMANSFYDTDIEKCIYYINKGLSYGTNDSLTALSQRAYAKLVQLNSPDYALDILNKNIPQNNTKDELQKVIANENAIIQELAKQPDKVVLSYLNAVATGIEADITKYEFSGDRFDLYFYERDLTPKKFIPKGSPLNIVKIDDISAAYNTPDTEKFFSVIYKNNKVDTLIYVLLVYDAGAWKVYGIV